MRLYANTCPEGSWQWRHLCPVFVINSSKARRILALAEITELRKLVGRIGCCCCCCSCWLDEPLKMLQEKLTSIDWWQATRWPDIEALLLLLRWVTAQNAVTQRLIGGRLDVVCSHQSYMQRHIEDSSRTALSLTFCQRPLCACFAHLISGTWPYDCDLRPRPV